MQNATLSSTFFEESRIKALSLQKEGETALLLWLRLFFTAVREDSDGKLMLYGTVAHDGKSISAVYGVPVAAAKTALELLIKFDLLVQSTDHYAISHFAELVSAHKRERHRKPWEYEYDSEHDWYICPKGGILRHTTTSKDGKRTYRTDPKHCASCPYKALCGANEKGQKVLMRHIWQEYFDLVEQLRKTERGKELYAMRKETIERVFADAKEKHAMRYTNHRGLHRVTNWVRLKFAAMNLKKLAMWVCKSPAAIRFFSLFSAFTSSTPACAF